MFAISTWLAAAFPAAAFSDGGRDEEERAARHAEWRGMVDTGRPWVILEKVRDFGRFRDFQHPPKRTKRRADRAFVSGREGRRARRATGGGGRLRSHMSYSAQPTEPQRFSDVANQAPTEGGSRPIGHTIRPVGLISLGGTALFARLATRRHAACTYSGPVEPPTHPQGR